MKSIEIENIKSFTSRLFAGTTFDHFLATDADFHMAVTYTIDGHLNPDFVGEEDMEFPENQEGIICWKKIRPVCYEILKGKKVPSQFKVIFKMPSYAVRQFLQKEELPVSEEQIEGLYLNIYFKNGKLTCTTGVSTKTFSMDRSLESQWDNYMEDFLKQF